MTRRLAEHGRAGSFTGTLPGVVGDPADGEHRAAPSRPAGSGSVTPAGLSSEASPFGRRYGLAVGVDEGDLEFS